MDKRTELRITHLNNKIDELNEEITTLKLVIENVENRLFELICKSSLGKD